MDTCVISTDMVSNKKRLTIQLNKDEEHLLEEAHAEAFARDLSLREFILEILKKNISADAKAVVARKLAKKRA